MGEEPPQLSTVRVAQLNRDLLYLIKKANDRGFATATEIRKMTKLRADIAAIKAGGDFNYVGGDS